MAATDQHYRNQKTLDMVFGISSVLMLLSIIGMFAQDYFRDFKVEQRAFRDVEYQMANRQLVEALPLADISHVMDTEQKVAAAREAAAQKRQELTPKIQQLSVQRDKLDAAYKSVKATYDSKESLLNIGTDERDDAPPTDQKLLNRDVTKLRDEVSNLRGKLEKAKQALDDKVTELRQVGAEMADVDRKVNEAETELKDLTRKFDQFSKLRKDKQWTIYDTIRAMPVLDGFASPYKIQQYTLNDYPIDYSFKFVTRYDRCTTCHQGMEKGNYTKEQLEKLHEAPTELNGKLKEFRDKVAAHIKELEQQPSADREARLKWWRDVQASLPPDVGTLDKSELTEARINQFKAHPRLDLFVDANSPHPAEKFGCTSCHSGQGSATDFKNATHTPNSKHTKEEWEKQFGWFHNHFWDYPMLANRFTESGCLKCHHQVTDLIRYGAKEEAPKLIRGFNLIRDNGCFGCHEIAGIKGGKEIGPDLRLEPGIPLDAKDPFERAKDLADPLNPPGTYRKVGPSLYRLSEKTNYDWLVKWINSPRTFRPDTKMPHFYNLSTNAKDVLPEDQKKLPDAEIHAIAFYLMQESQGYFKGPQGDIYRRQLLARKAQLEARKNDAAVTGGLTGPEQKELDEIDAKLKPENAPVLELREQPTPIKEKIVDGSGVAVAFPKAPDANARNAAILEGRRLFSEKGCLACHSHLSTEKKDGDIPAVTSHANFGPNLSQIAFKLGTLQKDDADSARRWLVQWILNPNVHFPRTKMPITFLNAEEANKVALWLLDQTKNESDEFKELAVPAPSTPTLKRLAKLLLNRVGTAHEVEDLFSTEPEAQKRGQAWLNRLRGDSDEAMMLKGGITDENLKLYIGKKAIGRLGCFGCHNIPGFETTKPIGTPLNDWGKKDAERLAFEDAEAWVKDNFYETDKLTDKDGKPFGPKEAKGGEEGKKKLPYESYFWEALEHHQRDGFLNQKLLEPRSYDYHRERAWDDRLRMPQFKFARTQRLPDEEDDAFEARKLKEEAEAREAVMTFILGLTAEPVPAKYLNSPGPDRMAEVKGRQVLDKFNCAGCHQVKAGVYEFKINENTLAMLADSYKTAAKVDVAANPDKAYPGDIEDLHHNSWVGNVQSWPADRYIAFGIEPPVDPDEEPTNKTRVRLTQALRFHVVGPEKKEERELRTARATIELEPENIISKSPKYGGAFPDIMLRYLMKKDNQKYKADGSDAFSAMPPTLMREGERTQPEWLFKFLRNPTPIRPYVLLRMPKFNMSEEDAQALVNYFSGYDKTHNPGIGLTWPYQPTGPTDPRYIRQKTKDYVARLAANGKLFGRAQELVEEGELKAKEADEALQRFKDLKKAADKAVEEKKQDAAAQQAAAQDMVNKAQKDVDELQRELKDLKDLVAKQDSDEKKVAIKKKFEDSDVYLIDGYKLLVNRDKGKCIACHNIGSVPGKESKGPPLNLAHERIRYDWMHRWVGYPERMVYYTIMPQNFEKGKPQPELFDLFDGPPEDQVTVLRDVLMNFPRVADLPAAQKYRLSQGGGK